MIVIKSEVKIEDVLQSMSEPGDELSDQERFRSMNDGMGEAYWMHVPSEFGNPEELAMRWETENNQPLAVCSCETHPYQAYHFMFSQREHDAHVLRSSVRTRSSNINAYTTHSTK